MSETSKFTAAREQMQATIAAFAPNQQPGTQPFAGLVFVERDGEDIDNDVEQALNTKGLAIIVLATTGGVLDQSRQGAAILRVTVPVCILENVARNTSNADATAGLPAGTMIPSELALQHVIRALLGKEIGDGCATLAKDTFARGGDEAGLIENYVGIDVPITLRGA